ncbi:MAG: diguanylate cyclase [Treponema sp.]|nr:diguanylate cyclase [Treponema sp.]
MIHTLLIFMVCFALVLSLFIGVYALFRSQSSKRNYFLLMQVVIIIYLIGYLLELTSTNAEEAFAAVRVLYIGFFVAPLAFFFVADYCNIKIHALFVKIPMLMVSMSSLFAMWTTRIHGLVYVDYVFDRTITNHLVFTPGPLYFVTRMFPIFCMLLTFGIMIYRLKEWKNKYRKVLLIFFYCALIPSIAEILYLISIVTGVNEQLVNFTPHSLAIMSFFLYIGVVRFNIFDIISIATVSAMEHIKEGFVLVDENNNYLSSNPAAVEMFPDMLTLKKGESIFAVKNWPAELGTMESHSAEFSMKEACAEGIRYYKASISPVYSDNKAVMAKIIIFSDITDSVILMKELEIAACCDGLTGLYNRKHFTELANAGIKRALRLKQPIYVGMLDIDYFKNINDTYGHAAGDIILKTVALIIRQTIRSYDLVGRYGGEEFAFLIADLEAADAFHIVERIRENIESHVAVYEGIKIKITCSIGLAGFLEDDTLETSLRKADTALYAAKNLGRNQVRTCEALIQGSTPQQFSWL